MPLLFGKTPARPDAVKLKLSNYIDAPALPPPPADFGHERLVTSWGMLGNGPDPADPSLPPGFLGAGCCVWSGAGHESMLWSREAGKTANITAVSTLRNYSAVTGYDPTTGVNDNGTDMEEAAKYRRKTGLLDADGKRHKIGAYVALKPGDLNELWYATYLFDGVGIGVEFPAQWMDAFNKGKPWDKVSRPKKEGGHYITGPSKREGDEVVISWGQAVRLTPAGYRQFNDETLAYLTEEKLINGRSLEGFDLATLRRDLNLVTSA